MNLIEITDRLIQNDNNNEKTIQVLNEIITNYQDSNEDLKKDFKDF